MHVVELDERLRDALCDAIGPHDNVSVHWGDAMQLDLAAFEPAPRKFVANLPYDIAAGLILRTIGSYPAMTRWVAMVQREVGERFAAEPATAAYGVPSVLAQLSCEVRVAADDLAQRVSTRSRTSTRSCCCSYATRVRTRPVELRGLVRGASPTAARRWPARWRWRPARRTGRVSGCVRRSSSSVIPPTCAPSASHPRIFARSRGC